MKAKTAAMAILSSALLIGQMAWAADAARPEGGRAGRGGPGGAGRGGEGGGPAAMMERMGGFRPPNVLMEALDADKNGIISAKEIEGAVAALKKLDKNADGQLTADELAPPSPAGAGFVDRIMAMDANKDGKVTKEEAPEQMQRLFERADTNADGAIDKAEAEAAGQVMQRMGGREQGGAPGPEAAAERPRRQRTEAQE